MATDWLNDVLIRGRGQHEQGDAQGLFPKRQRCESELSLFPEAVSQIPPFKRHPKDSEDISY